jgi:hypothetical protein
MQISGHKNVAFINNYSTLSEERHKKISNILSNIFNLSIRSGHVPQDWRDANVTPLFKKGSRSIATNYRPVSLTSQIVKLFNVIR